MRFAARQEWWYRPFKNKRRAIKERRCNMVEYTYTFITVKYKVKVRAAGMLDAIAKFKKICPLDYIKVYRV